MREEIPHEIHRHIATRHLADEPHEVSIGSEKAIETKGKGIRSKVNFIVKRNTPISFNGARVCTKQERFRL